MQRRSQTRVADYLARITRPLNLLPAACLATTTRTQTLGSSRLVVYLAVPTTLSLPSQEAYLEARTSSSSNLQQAVACSAPMRPRTNLLQEACSDLRQLLLVGSLALQTRTTTLNLVVYLDPRARSLLQEASSVRQTTRSQRRAEGSLAVRREPRPAMLPDPVVSLEVMRVRRTPVRVRV